MKTILAPSSFRNHNSVTHSLVLLPVRRRSYVIQIWEKKGENPAWMLVGALRIPDHPSFRHPCDPGLLGNMELENIFETKPTLQLAICSVLSLTHSLTFCLFVNKRLYNYPRAGAGAVLWRLRPPFHFPGVRGSVGAEKGEMYNLLAFFAQSLFCRSRMV